MYDVFTDMTDPAGQPGTQLRSEFDHAIDGIRDVLGAEVLFKLLPIARDVIGTKTGTIYCPPVSNLARNLPYYRAVLRQAGPRIRIYESSNEMEYTCSKLWGYSSAGARGVSTLLGKHFAQNMPALKKEARALGFEILTVGYIGTPGGFGWGDSIASPRLFTATEFLTAVQDAYVASGGDPDYLPDAISIHAYPYSGDFGFDARREDILAYYSAWTSGVRAELVRIFGAEVGGRIRLVMSEWNAGIQSWPGWSDGRAAAFYGPWLSMLRADGWWAANQFNIASQHDVLSMITMDGTTTPTYDAFRAASLADPVH